jgi:hypothetical protein
VSASNEHRDLGFSPQWEDALNAARNQQDLSVPESYFTEAESSLILLTKKSSGEEFDVPEGYFEFGEERIMQVAAASPSDDEFFDKQQDQILKRIRLEAADRNDLSVPEGYFEAGGDKILQRINPAAKVISMRSRFFWYAGAAAAMIAGVVFFILPGNKSTAEVSFAELAAKTELDLEDLEYFASEDELYDLYYMYEEMQTSDTLVQDSTGQNLKGLEAFETAPGVTSGEVQLDPRTGLPLKKTKGNVKPSDAAHVPSWEDISNEELLEYLLEEGDEDLMNDL